MAPVPTWHRPQCQLAPSNHQLLIRSRFFSCERRAGTPQARRTPPLAPPRARSLAPLACTLYTCRSVPTWHRCQLGTALGANLHLRTTSQLLIRSVLFLRTTGSRPTSPSDASPRPVCVLRTPADKCKLGTAPSANLAPPPVPTCTVEPPAAHPVGFFLALDGQAPHKHLGRLPSPHPACFRLFPIYCSLLLFYLITITFGGIYEV